MAIASVSVSLPKERSVMSLRFLLAAALCVLITPSVLAQALVGGDAADVLTAHNNERARVGVSALVWDDQLAADAADWAQELARRDTIEHAQNTGQGENLAMGTKDAFTALGLVDGWLGEGKDYVPGRAFPNVSRTGTEVVGHYTQMIWADTTHVGCAMGQSASNDILVCRYFPQGNIIGRFVVPPGTATATAPSVIQPPQFDMQRPAPTAAPNVAGVQKFELTSTAFVNGARIPVEHTADGGDFSPPLAWSGAPPGTKSFLLTYEDLDAPTPDGLFLHWFVINIPGDTNYLLAGLPRLEALSTPAGAVQGVNDFNEIGYGGPSPPAGSGPHRYVFTLHAMDRVFDRDPNRTQSESLKLVEESILAATQLIGTYERR